MDFIPPHRLLFFDRKRLNDKLNLWGYLLGNQLRPALERHDEETLGFTGHLKTFEAPTKCSFRGDVPLPLLKERSESVYLPFVLGKENDRAILFFGYFS
jgi:hypothetical protein